MMEGNTLGAVHVGDDASVTLWRVPVNKDNYAWLLTDVESGVTAAVDPGQAPAVLRVAKEQGWSIDMVLTTHHHWDHADGNPGMVDAVSGLKVYGGSDGVAAVTSVVHHEEEIPFGRDQAIRALHTPCHTQDHICYFLQPRKGQPIVFTGDTLFLAGCGRFFEGDGDQMNRALNEVLAALPRETLVCCGHEYSVANCHFALSVDPQNEALMQKFEECKARRSAGLATVPSTMAEEVAINPFMRLHTPDIRSALGVAPDTADGTVMAALRTRKNEWKPPKL